MINGKPQSDGKLGLNVCSSGDDVAATLCFLTNSRVLIYQLDIPDWMMFL